MKRFLLCILFSFSLVLSIAQPDDTNDRQLSVEKTKPVATKPAAPAPVNNGSTTSNDFIIEKIIQTTPVKNQQQTGTCWSFSTTSLVETQALKNKLGEFDLSEWFTVRNIYIEKAKNYILRQGYTRFTEGALGHDQIRAIAKYGTMPESAYSGLSVNVDIHDHHTLSSDLKAYLDTVLKNKPINPNWLAGFTGMLDKFMGTPPETFVYNNKSYTPVSFAKDVLKFNQDDYVNITSFTHHPYYSSFVLEVPDNFSNGIYHNIPLTVMLDLVKASISNGYSVMWDADISNSGFRAKQGIAVNLGGEEEIASFKTDFNTKETTWNEKARQRLFENLTTQDDHLMHIVGIEKTKDGKLFFNVKNSYGFVGPFNGYIKVSEAYLAMNTISIILPKAALSKTLLEKLKL